MHTLFKLILPPTLKVKTVIASRYHVITITVINVDNITCCIFLKHEVHYYFKTNNVKTVVTVLTLQRLFACYFAAWTIYFLFRPLLCEVCIVEVLVCRNWSSWHRKWKNKNEKMRRSRTRRTTRPCSLACVNFHCVKLPVNLHGETFIFVNTCKCLFDFLSR